ncbi:unnamed protein product [Amoebophrya sp. A120]|nr:unnamed protein product [Amoebophrya sp. A120]|eukprot:GSA120T00018811001.1
MTSTSSAHFVYPKSGENPWQRVLSGDSARAWRRSLQSTDVRFYSQSKGRLFDSHDPREAVRLMREKEVSKEPRHTCIRPPLEFDASEFFVKDGTSTTTPKKPMTADGSLMSTTTTPVVAKQEQELPTLLRSASSPNHGHNLSTSTTNSTKKVAFTGTGETPPTTAPAKTSSSQSPAAASSRGRGHQTAHTKADNGSSNTGKYSTMSTTLMGKDFMAAPCNKKKIVSKPFFDPGATQRLDPDDTCLYETAPEDRAWSADVEHRWNRPNLTNFWTHQTQCRIEYHNSDVPDFTKAIQIDDAGDMRINGKLARLKVPQYRQNMLYKDYYLKQLYKKDKRNSSMDTKQSLDKTHHYHWSDADKSFTSDEIFEPNTSVKALRLTDLTTDFAHHGFPRSDWSVPGRMQAFHQQRKIIPEANDARARRRAELAAMKQQRLANTQVYGDNRGDAWHPGKLYLRGQGVQ